MPKPPGNLWNIQLDLDVHDANVIEVYRALGGIVTRFSERGSSLCIAPARDYEKDIDND